MPPSPAAVRASTTLVFRHDPDSSVESQLFRAIAAGERVVVAISAEVADADLAALSARLGEVRLGAERWRPDALDPLVADGRCTATTPTGLRLQLDRVRPLEAAPDDVVLARLDDGAPVAIERQVGRATVVIIGTSSMHHPRWASAGDNAEALAAWSGRPDPAGHASRVAASATPFAGSTSPLTVTAPGGWLDPELARSTDVVDLVAVAGRLGRRLPDVVHDALVAFADESHPSGALLVRGMPIGDVPPTPDHPTAPSAKDATSELSLLTVARRLGQPVGYLPEHGGTLVQNILPTRASVGRQLSTSSDVELMFHTEAAFHPHRPRFLLLLCLRGDPAARTTLASIHDLLPTLPLSVRRVLFERRFRTAADESYVGGRPTQLGAPMAVLSGEWDAPTLVFDADLMVGTDEEAEAALGHLARAVADHHTGVVLEPGDLLVVDNTVAVHGRTPFSARFDGTDRWVQRSFVVGDLTPSAGERRDRVITTRFAP